MDLDRVQISSPWVRQLIGRLAGSLPQVCAFGLVVATGCRTLSSFQPAEQKVIAAREMSRLGLDALQKGRLDEAQVRLQHALRQCPQDAEARRTWAQILWARGQRSQAIAEMDTAVRLFGNEPTWMLELGEWLLAEGEYRVAAECAARARSAAPHLAAAWVLTGDVLLAQGEWSEALNAYHRALSEPDPPHKVLLSVASIYEKQGRPQRALATLRRFEDLTKPAEQPLDLQLRQGMALLALGRPQQALSKLEIARSRLGLTPQIALLTSQALAALGRHAESEEQWKLAKQLEEERPRMASASVEVPMPGPSLEEPNVSVAPPQNTSRMK